MIIQDLMQLFCESESQKIELYDLTSNRTVYEGKYEDMPSKYDYCEICSIDTLFTRTDTLTINVDISEMDLEE